MANACARCPKKDEVEVAMTEYWWNYAEALPSLNFPTLPRSAKSGDLASCAEQIRGLISSTIQHLSPQPPPRYRTSSSISLGTRYRSIEQLQYYTVNKVLSA